jgi:hypothetical protein
MKLTKFHRTNILQTLRKNKLLFLLIFILILMLLGLSTIRCVGVIEVVKCWNGNWLSSVTGVKATLSNGTIVYNDGLPVNNKIDIFGVWQGQSITFNWTDGNGPQTETFGPLVPPCGGGAYTVTNTINHPTIPTHLKNNQDV